MKTQAGIALFMGLFAGVFFHAVHAAPPTARKAINWHSDLKKAHKESLNQNRPMLIVFAADWCDHCRKMDRTTLADPHLITRINNDFIPVRLDIKKDRKIAEILDVERIPSTIFLSPRADLLGRTVGFVGQRQYQETVDKVQIVHKHIEEKLAQAAGNQSVPTPEVAPTDQETDSPASTDRSTRKNSESRPDSE